MTNKTLLSFSIALAMSTVLTAQTQITKLRLHTIGDSTMADYQEATTRTRGWGEMLQEFFSADVQVIDYARGGRSSRTFYEEGLWQKVKDNLKLGDYVLIQFAHNDEFSGGEDDPGHRGTAPWTTYRRHLEYYVDETRQLGGTPIFVTPIVRRYFLEDGTISRKGCHDISKTDNDSILNYVRVMKTVAAERQVELVDLTALTKQFTESLGKEATIKQIYVPTDGTHTQATGAALYAQLAVTGMKRQGILSEYIQTQPAMILNPIDINFDLTYVGDCQMKMFDVIGLKLSADTGSVKLTAPQGLLLADNPEKDPQQELVLPYKDGKLWNTSFCLYFAPTSDTIVSSPVIISEGNLVRHLQIHAQGKQSLHDTPTVLTAQNLDLSVKGLVETASGYDIEQGEVWPPEIDEVAKRYVEFVVRGNEKALRLKELSFLLKGDIAYRLAVAGGKDFYPRTDIGELQQNGEDQRQVNVAINKTVAAGSQLNIRLFPWVVGGGKRSFKIEDVKIQAIELE